MGYVAKTSDYSQFKLPRVVRVWTRTKYRYRFQKGEIRVQLPGEPGEPDFMNAYRKALHENGEPDFCDKGSPWAADRLMAEAQPRKIASMLSNARLRAEAKGVPFQFTVDDLRETFAAQGWRCALSGIELRFTADVGGMNTPSMDRIQPALGYVPGNVRMLCHAVNIARHLWSDAEFIKMCRAVTRHSSTKRKAKP